MQESINKKSMLKVGTILHDTYRIDSYLSSGGFGNTYVATNIAFEERVAIKEFFMKGVTERDGNHTTVSVSNSENTNSFLEQKEKFKKEARRLRRLKNEHIVKVHDLFDENGTAYYVMDYMDGENLSERLKRIGRPMTESEVNLLLPQILDALKAVHNEGFCHLDIKPSNIMLEKGNKVKLIDFGASKQLGAKGTLTSNESTAFAKTPGFAPREQIEQNLDKIGPWTDIYALGATLYCLLTTKYPPMPSDIDDDMSLDKHLALPMPETAGGLKNLVLQMMKTNRLQRPQSIDAIISAVKSRDNGFEQIPVQQEPLQDGKYEDEGTIVEGSQPETELDTEETEEVIGGRTTNEPNNTLSNIIMWLAIILPFIGIPYGMSIEDATLSPLFCWCSGMGAILLLFFSIYIRESKPKKETKLDTKENEFEKQMRSEGPILKYGRKLIGCLVVFVGLLFISDCHELYQWTVVIAIIIAGGFLLFFKGL